MADFKKPSVPSFDDLTTEELGLLILEIKSKFPNRRFLIDELSELLEFKVITDSLCEKFIRLEFPRTASVMRGFLHNENAKNIGATKFGAELRKRE